MHQLIPLRARGSAPLRYGTSAGHSLIEVMVALAVIAVLAPPVLGAATNLRTSFVLRRSQENAVRLLAEARWTAVRDGSAVVELVSAPPHGRVVSATGDTVMVADLGQGGVALRLSRDRPTSRVRYGPMGLGWVSSQTLRFTRGDQERALVISSLGRVARR